MAFETTMSDYEHLSFFCIKSQFKKVKLPSAVNAVSNNNKIISNIELVSIDHQEKLRLDSHS
ncbi:CLUMA_CG003640, isoform A [Clunio marinus]|uniref:CLUMA_CG003640, isoform A n=1 Tax=Clunio marinus TaxID=568069 RepID=A0A1J1HPD1_9DIPT|nr:CLUMA_CG003640, isoform A [Clunio marinus]